MVNINTDLSYKPRRNGMRLSKTMVLVSATFLGAYKQ